MGSFSSYQLSHTESNFDVIISIDSVPRSDTVDHQIDRFPRFPLRNHPEGEQRFLSDAESEFVTKFHLDEDEINTLEGDTREQANSQLWVSERKYRFTASNFHLISHRQRHHEYFANTVMHPKPFTSTHTRRGMKYDPEAVHAYMKYMNNRSIPVEIFKSGLVVLQKGTSTGMLT